MSTTISTTRKATGPAPNSVEFRYNQSESFVALLRQLGASLLVSTYQANKLLVARAAGAGLSMLVRTFDKPMGLAVDGPRLALGTRKEVWYLRDAPDIASQIDPGRHDACFLPRWSHVTGDLGIHEIAWARWKNQASEIKGQPAMSVTNSGSGTPNSGSLTSELWLVSTRFSCLCTLDPDYSFVPRWRPPFVTALAAEDRCHLNGLAIVDGSPRYVTALGVTNVRDGWRPDKPHGGCLIDVESGEFVARGLSMPHSPRWHDPQAHLIASPDREAGRPGRLWLLESGTGRLVIVDLASGKRETVAELPGFTRGLAMVGPYAFVGLSKIRDTSAMDGVPLAQRRNQLKCGVAVVDLRSGQTTAWLEFQSAVEEIFDVQLLPGLRFPELIGFQQDTIQHTFVVPPQSMAG